MTIMPQPNAHSGPSLSDVSSNAVASTSTKPVSKPLSRAAKVAGPSSKPRSRAANQQPALKDLKKFGIKVRDFAYESKLPPVRTIYQHKTQYQPNDGPRPLERKATEPDASQDAQSQESQLSRKLERAPTEPTPTPKAPSRIRNLDEFGAIQAQDIFNSQSPNVDSETPMSRSALESQAWNVQNVNDIPSSRVAVACESQAVVPQLSSTSQVGISQPLDYSQQIGEPSDSQTNTAAAKSSPLTVVSSPRTLASAAMNMLPSRSRPTTLRSNSSQDFTATPTTPRITATRYYLRKRPAPPIPHSPPIPAKRARKDPPTEASSSRRHPISTQSSHSPIKSKDNAGSSSSRTLRQRAVETGKGKWKRS